ncbi:aminodeoxychorismate/anthranilate synthase component II [Pseudodesulfovibrio sp. zrk46]|uniref:aminodeoxychorismate/anthranilate synthase component II n=1 Tax=Pseudodesulfovibrio sp. zrk46 TaxID=2725288 RepID=UPI0014496937|nr:aminodeoxychorismate/anthranilate synthase component II [Pseudodesulfovibrio sp. zrk46]QJB55997.1 aminodeoxychorismate/anthranilate synthase component II [Pseudodesulfovibrio sp. zrk46]
MHILLIDNNDSFTRNLEHLLVSAIKGAEVVVEPYTRLPQLDLTAADLIVVSPGPGTPAEYPGYERVFESGKPVLGICLGMQIMNEHHGGETGRLPGCVHGKTDEIDWLGEQQTVARYHSLCVTKVGDGLEVMARNDQDVVMCLGSRDHRAIGYQFHPESFLTSNGGRFIRDAIAYLDLQ